MPIKYEDTNAVHALQWAIGLEWFLRVDDPWQVALSTDHPNGGSFLAYPQIIALLMDRGLRNDTLATLPAKVQERCPAWATSRGNIRWRRSPSSPAPGRPGCWA